MANLPVRLAGLLAAALPAPLLAAEQCAMSPADRAWLGSALAQWERSQHEELRVAQPTMPTVYAVDERCTHVLPGGSLEAMTGETHPPGKATIPELGEVPLGPISFAFAADGFVMSLPSVWRAAGVDSGMGLERLMTGVLLHEILHTRQSEMVETIAVPAAAAQGLEDELSDDLLQERFEKNPAYARAFSDERDALFAAATADEDAVARGLAAHALHLMRDRRARWLSGPNAHFAVLDDVYLTMEGAGQWLIYRYFLSPEGGSADPAVALRETRRGAKWWSQDEGLALALTLDRLLPDWRERLFRHPDWLAEDLLAAAVSEPVGSPKSTRPERQRNGE